MVSHCAATSHGDREPYVFFAALAARQFVWRLALRNRMRLHQTFSMSGWNRTWPALVLSLTSNRYWNPCPVSNDWNYRETYVSLHSKCLNLVLAALSIALHTAVRAQTGAPLTPSQAGVFYEDKLMALGEQTALE